MQRRQVQADFKQTLMPSWQRMKKKTASTCQVCKKHTIKNATSPEDKGPSLQSSRELNAPRTIQTYPHPAYLAMGPNSRGPDTSVCCSLLFCADLQVQQPSFLPCTRVQEGDTVLAHNRGYERSVLACPQAMPRTMSVLFGCIQYCR